MRKKVFKIHLCLSKVSFRISEESNSELMKVESKSVHQQKLRDMKGK